MRHTQTRFINALHTSHDWEALSELQLIPAYYPSANRPASSERLAAAENSLVLQESPI